MQGAAQDSFPVPCAVCHCLGTAVNMDVSGTPQPRLSRLPSYKVTLVFVEPLMVSIPSRLGHPALLVRVGCAGRVFSPGSRLGAVRAGSRAGETT